MFWSHLYYLDFLWPNKWEYIFLGILDTDTKSKILGPVLAKNRKFHYIVPLHTWKKGLVLAVSNGNLWWSIFCPLQWFFSGFVHSFMYADCWAQSQIKNVGRFFWTLECNFLEIWKMQEQSVYHASSSL